MHRRWSRLRSSLRPRRNRGLGLAAWVILVCASLGTSSSVIAQDDGAGADAPGASAPAPPPEEGSGEAPEPTEDAAEALAAAEAWDPTKPDPDVSITDLDLKLTALRVDELEPVVEAWLTLLAENVAELSRIQIALQNLEGDEREALLEEVTALRDERSRLIDRVRVAITGWVEKGGDATEHLTYIDAVSAVHVDASNLSEAWITARGWAVSSEGGVRYLRNTGKFLLTLIIAWIAARIFGSVVRHSMRRFGNASELLKATTVRWMRNIVLVIGLLVALAQIGIDVTPMVTALGAAGIVIGLAMQDTLSNFFSGFMILLYRPFDVDDLVDVAGVEGRVASMTPVSTCITTLDNQNLVVPNNAIWGSVIRNITGSRIRRVDLVFGVGYDDDLAKAQRVLEEIIATTDHVLDDPEPMIKVHQLGESSVDFIVRPWVRTDDYWDVYWHVTRAVKDRFDAEGISIPFPQRDVHLIQASAAAAAPPSSAASGGGGGAAGSDTPPGPDHDDSDG